jgi:hypothetical protein
MSTASSVKTGTQVYRPGTTLHSRRQPIDDVCGPINVFLSWHKRVKRCAGLKA